MTSSSRTGSLRARNQRRSPRVPPVWGPIDEEKRRFFTNFSTDFHVFLPGFGHVPVISFVVRGSFPSEAAGAKELKLTAFLELCD